MRRDADILRGDETRARRGYIAGRRDAGATRIFSGDESRRRRTTRIFRGVESTPRPRETRASPRWNVAASDVPRRRSAPATTRDRRYDDDRSITNWTEASDLSALDYFDSGRDDARCWRSGRTQRFSRERRFPKLREFDTKGRAYGFRRKKIRLHERFHDVDRGRRRRARRAPRRSPWGDGPQSESAASSFARVPGAFAGAVAPGGRRDDWGPASGGVRSPACPGRAATAGARARNAFGDGRGNAGRANCGARSRGRGWARGFS